MSTRSGLDSPLVNACRLREATRGIYNHAQEQAWRAENALAQCQSGDPTEKNWATIRDHLNKALQSLRVANALACENARFLGTASQD